MPSSALAWHRPLMKAFLWVIPFYNLLGTSNIILRSSWKKVLHFRWRLHLWEWFSQGIWLTAALAGQDDRNVNPMHLIRNDISHPAGNKTGDAKKHFVGLYFKHTLITAAATNFGKLFWCSTSIRARCWHVSKDIKMSRINMKTLKQR